MSIKSYISNLITLLAGLCLSTVQVDGQIKDSLSKSMINSHDAGHYTQKAKRQKTIAWTLLGTGAGVTLAGFVTGARIFDNLDDFERRANTAGVIAFTGGGVMLSSIPFFIASGRNHRKAVMHLSMGHFRLPVKIVNSSGVMVVRGVVRF